MAVAPLSAIYYKNTGKLLRKYTWITPQIIVNFALLAAISDVHVEFGANIQDLMDNFVMVLH